MIRPRPPTTKPNGNGNNIIEPTNLAHVVCRVARRSPLFVSSHRLGSSRLVNPSAMHSQDYLSYGACSAMGWHRDLRPDQVPRVQGHNMYLTYRTQGTLGRFGLRKKRVSEDPAVARPGWHF